VKNFVLRLHPGQDLKEELKKFTKENNVQAGFIVTCVGSLQKAAVRFAGQKDTKNINGKFEIVSLVGTLSRDSLHSHISFADENGKIIGGHVKEGCIIYTTAEIVIGECEDLIFSRELDRQTNFKELKVSNRSK